MDPKSKSCISYFQLTRPVDIEASSFQLGLLADLFVCVINHRCIYAFQT